MAERVSTGHANSQLDGFVTDYSNGVLAIFGGASQPATADDAELGTLLCLVTRAGGVFTAGQPENGLNYGTPANGVVDKSGSEVWKGTILQSGVATYFRFYANTYVTGASTTAKRFDGAISTSATSELQMLNTTLTAGGEVTVTSLPVTYPRS